jgi:hypothetical protein
MASKMNLTDRMRLSWMTARHEARSAAHAWQQKQEVNGARLQFKSDFTCGVCMIWKFLSAVDLPATLGIFTSCKKSQISQYSSPDSDWPAHAIAISAQ